ncbi:MAG: hypothetical protein ACTSYI_00670 [Promethearchaeota archaeon]
MSQKIPDNSAFPSIFCPTCGSQVETDLVDDLAQGITIFCASCGHKFDYQTHKHRLHSKTRSSVKPPIKSRVSQPKSSRSHPLDYNFSPRPDSPTHSQIPKSKVGNLEGEEAKAKEYRQYRKIQKQNRKDFRHVKKINRDRFRTPRDQSKKDYRKLQQNHKKDYIKIKNENNRTYQIALLSEVMTNPAEIAKIKRNYRRVKRKNKREYGRTKKKYANSYRRVRRSNRATFRKSQKTNRQKFHKNNEANQQLWQKFSLTLNNQYLNFSTFDPVFVPVENFRVFDPSIFVTQDPKMNQKFEPTKTASYSPDTPQTAHLYGQSNTKVPKKVAKFDPMTGKPLQSTQKPIAKFDTMTGKPLPTPDIPEAPESPKAPDAPIQEESEKQILSPIPEEMPRSHQSQKIPKTPIKEEPEVKESFGNLKEIYTVLDEEVREKLLKLPISEEDRDIIAKSFIYLNNTQQIKYLEELSAVNMADLETRKELTNVIQNLPIPHPQKEFLVDQLNYLNETEQDDFVITLERSKSEEIAEENSEIVESPEIGVKHQATESIQQADSEQPEKIEIATEAKPETVEEEVDPERLRLEGERDKLLQLKEKKSRDEELHRKGLEKQKLEEERLERVKNLKEKIKKTQKTEGTKKKKKKSSIKIKKRKTLE